MSAPYEETHFDLMSTPYEETHFDLMSAPYEETHFVNGRHASFARHYTRASDAFMAKPLCLRRSAPRPSRHEE